MLEELLKHDKLGNKKELLFVLFDAISTSGNQTRADLKKFCASNLFSISRSFDGILKLLEAVSFIEIKGNVVKLNRDIFDPSKVSTPYLYFKGIHFFKNLILLLKRTETLADIFNERNVKYNSNLARYYVKDNMIPYKFFPLRNLLLSLDVLERDETLENHLLLKEEFNDAFKSFVVEDIIRSRKQVSRKVPLSELKKSLENKEVAGKEAELFVLEFERHRLSGHPSIEQLIRVSEDFTNAGYDIKSFNDKESIIIDRFIEVKSFKEKVSFFWSRNEVQIAKELAENYFLYLVDRSKMNTPEYLPIIIQNPHKKVFESEMWKKEVENWKIIFE